jgi:hypothetical protein
MNTKQLVPLLAKLGLFGVFVWTLGSLFSDNDAEKKPKTTPANAGAENRDIPAAVPVPSAPRAVVPPPAVPFVQKVSAPSPMPAAGAIPKITSQALPLPPIKKKFVTRNDLATVFHHGARALTRTAVVAAFKQLGFGKTAAYDALSPGGRFSTWLQCAPDGIITWTDR